MWHEADDENERFHFSADQPSLPQPFPMDCDKWTFVLHRAERVLSWLKENAEAP